MSGRVAIAFRGDSRSPGAWSGIPHGLARGFEALGVEVRHVSAGVPPRVENALVRVLARRHFAHVSSARAQLAALRTGRVTATVQIGTEFRVWPRGPLATFEDMTVPQHVRLGDAWTAGMPPRDLAAWTRRQGRIYRQAAVCCIASHWAARSLIEDFGVPPGKVAVTGLGHNHEVTPQERDWTVPRFLFVGHDWRRKNAEQVIAAFRELVADRADARLDIVGGFPGAGGPGVTVHGPLRMTDPRERARVAELFAQATCFVMPSQHEAFGIVYVEAGAAGIASIGTTVGGAREAIGPGGVLVDPQDRAGLLAAMRRLCAPEEARRLGGLAREHARGFTWAAVAERVLEALAAPRDGGPAT